MNTPHAAATDAAAKKHGLDELISADAVRDYDHDVLFARLQSATLDYRLQEGICSLVGRAHSTY
jgi:hypothetical protein